MVERFTSDPIELPVREEGDPEYTRADLTFYGVDHSGDSFEARVFLDNPRATVRTGRSDPSFVGAFHIFGHGGCFGDMGHCDVPTDPQDPFDLRPPHQLTPQTKLVTMPPQILERIASAEEGETITVTVVAETPGDASNRALAFDRLRLLTYS